MKGKEGKVVRTISIFVLAVLLLAPMSINAAESDETKETMEVLSNEVTGTWKAIGPEGRKIYAVAIDPSNTSTIYAGTDDGVFKSTDGGESWSATGLTNTNVNALAIDPANHSIIAGTDDDVYRSTDGGGHWYFSVGPSNVNGLAIDPTNPDIIYASALTLGI